MDMITVTAKTVDEAVTKALIELETTSDKLEYEVVDKGSAGFLGIGAKPAIIRAKKKETVADKAIEFLSQIFDAMNLEVSITAAYNEEEQEISLNLEGEDMGILIGKRGQTLDSLQYLVSLIVKKALNMAKSMEIPVIGLVENYSYVICPDCGKEFKIFGESGLDKLAEELDLPILGRMPIDPKLAELASGEFAKANNEYLAAAESLLIALEG